MVQDYCLDEKVHPSSWETSVGQGVAESFKANRVQKMFISSGAGAGLAAAFNAPIAGLMFVLERSPSYFLVQLVAVTTLTAAIRLTSFH